MFLWLSFSVFHCDIWIDSGSCDYCDRVIVSIWGGQMSAIRGARYNSMVSWNDKLEGDIIPLVCNTTIWNLIVLWWGRSVERRFANLCSSLPLFFSK